MSHTLSSHNLCTYAHPQTVISNWYDCFMLCLIVAFEEKALVYFHIYTPKFTKKDRCHGRREGQFKEKS